MKNLLNGIWINKNQTDSFLEIKDGILFELTLNGISALDKNKRKNLLEEFKDIQTLWDIENNIGIIVIDKDYIKVCKYEEPLILETALIIGDFIRK